VVIVDSTVWIDFFNGVETPETDWLDRELSEQRLGVLDLIVCEVLQGVSSDEEAEEVLGSCAGWKSSTPVALPSLRQRPATVAPCGLEGERFERLSTV
jgi:predicted nucleic acid-binding protein